MSRTLAGARGMENDPASAGGPAADFEARVQSVYEAVLRSGDTVVDVGAHVGRHCIPMARLVAPAGRVLAFEPLPMCRRALVDALRQDSPPLDSVVTLYPYALGADDGRAEFTVAEDALAYSGLQERVYDFPTRVRRIAVEVHRLDSLLLSLPDVRYIKIDAEGGEFDVFRGAVRSLERFRPLVTFECGANALAEYGVSAHDIGEFWLAHGYTLRDIVGQPLPDRDSFARSAEAQQVWDYVAIPAEDDHPEQVVVRALNGGAAT